MDTATQKTVTTSARKPDTSPLSNHAKCGDMSLKSWQRIMWRQGITDFRTCRTDRRRTTRKQMSNRSLTYWTTTWHWRKVGGKPAIRDTPKGRQTKRLKLSSRQRDMICPFTKMLSTLGWAPLRDAGWPHNGSSHDKGCVRVRISDEPL